MRTQKIERKRGKKKKKPTAPLTASGYLIRVQTGMVRFWRESVFLPVLGACAGQRGAGAEPQVGLTRPLRAAPERGGFAKNHKIK